MNDFYSLGTQIRRLRHNKGESLSVAAEKIGVNRSYLNKVELGISRPSAKVLNSIIDHFSVEGNEAAILLRLHEGLTAEKKSSETGRKEESDMDQAVVPRQVPQGPNVQMNPDRHPVLYSDSVFVHSSDFGLVLDFAQRVGPSDQQFVVSRIGMSFEHAKKLLEVVNDHLQKNER